MQWVSPETVKLIDFSWLTGPLLTVSAVSCAHAQVIEQPIAARLPEPSAAPLDPARHIDPIFAVAEALADEAAFQEMIRQAMAANPLLAEGKADGRAALAAKRGATMALFPTVDLALNANRAIAREYSNDPDNIIERSRGKGRLDAVASVEQVLFDFGARHRRIDAAIERIDAAEAELDRKSDAVALRAISVWYDLFAYGHLSELAENYLSQNERLRRDVDKRISQGVAAPVERARIESGIASAKLRKAQFGRELDNARSRFTELFGFPPPDRIARAPAKTLDSLSNDALAELAADTAPVRVANASARAARSDAEAARADTFPNITAGVDAGRYGLFEPGRRDYDVRGRVTLRLRLFGNGDARADEARALAEAAEARALSARMEAEREARIAWSDVRALQATLDAYRHDYTASRVTRDATTERFRVFRGTLFDAIDSEERLFIAAASYIRALAEHDTAIFVAIARTGDLLKTIGVELADRGAFQ